jgi:hypothetical protein
LPIRRVSRSEATIGPRPFSEEWLNATPEPPKRSGAFGFPAWLPSEKALAAILVAVLVLISVPWRHTGGVKSPEPDQNIVAAAIPTNTPLVPVMVNPTATLAPGQEATGTAQGPANAGTQLEGTPPTRAAGGEILPAHRVLSYYGFPGDENMGILGELSMEQLLDQLRQQGAEYEAADPSRPVQLAFEVIASVAQAWPGDDGDHLAYIGEDVLQQYVDFTAQNGLLLILDMQFGRRTVQQEIEAVEKWLKYPHVHLALDPEFSVDEGQVPGEVFGQIDASDVQWAQHELVRISQENEIPSKLLIVHQFTEESITNKSRITPVEGVQFVLEVDGYGTPDEKRETYSVVTAGDPMEYYGFKLWYKQDDPLMSATDVLGLTPAPDLVIYQ